MMNFLVQHIEALLATTVIGFISIFSDKILGRIRLRWNRADLRVKYYERLAKDLSRYIFFAELFHERHQREWASNPADMAAIGGEVNAAVVRLRINEYVYRAWVEKYWDSRGVERFAEVLDAVTATEDAIHAFNDEGQVAEKTTVLGRELARLRALSVRFLSGTDA